MSCRHAPYQVLVEESPCVVCVSADSLAALPRARDLIRPPIECLEDRDAM